jgi:hypothetical protein
VTKPVRVLRDLSKAILRREVAGRQGSAEVAAAIEGTFAKLQGLMQDFIGHEGFRALLERAVFLAKSDFGWLGSIAQGEAPSLSFKGSAEAVEREGSRAATDGFGAVLSNFIGLLETFIGADLTLRLLRRIWPEIPPEGTARGEGEGKRK